MAPWSDAAKKGESGLADRMWFHVSAARFAFPYENATDTCALILDGERNIDGEISDDHIWLKPGAFEPGDKDGTFAIHEDQNPKRHFNKNSGLGKFLKSADEVGLLDVLEARQPADRQVYETKDALVWVGLDLDIEFVEEEFELKRGPEAGKKVTSRQPFIRGYKTPEGATGSASAAPASSTAAESNGAIDEATAAAMAKSAPNFIKFLEDIVAKGVDPGHEWAQNNWYAAHHS